MRLLAAILLGVLLAFVTIGALAEHLIVAALLGALGLAIVINPAGGRILERRGFRPWPRLGIGAGLLLAALIAVGATRQPTPAEIAERRERANERALAAKHQAEAEERTAEVRRREADERIKAAIVGGYRQTLENAEPCDAAYKRMGTIDARQGAVAAYAQAREGHTTCEAAWLAISKLEPDEALKGAIEEAVEAAIERCGSAYFLKQRALEKMMGMLDGDSRPSAALALQEDAKAGQAGVLACVASWYEAAGKAGIKPEALR